MKEIGAAIGVNESRVSQLHARAVHRLKKALGAECGLSPVIDFQSTMRKIRMAREDSGVARGRLLEYRTPSTTAGTRKPAAAAQKRMKTAAAPQRLAAAR